MDDVDRKIISQLHVDGRTTFKKLAEATGYTRIKAYNALDRMLKS